MNDEEKIRILILDDDATIIAALKEMLSDRYEIAAAAGYGEFKQIMGSFSPHILFLDLNLPDGNGLDICQTLRGDPSLDHLYILIITSTNNNSVIEMCYASGANDLLPKPFIPREIVSKVRSFEKIILIQRELRRKNAQYRSEISKIRNIQVAQIPDFKEVSGYDIAYGYLPAQDISGDFMDGFFISDTVYQLVLCDISGHGMASAYIGNEVRTMLKTLSLGGGAMAEIAVRVNDTLAANIRNLYYFATLVMCRFDLRSGTVEYLNAGHPDVFLQTVRDYGCRALGRTGPLLGLFPDKQYAMSRIEMSPGDSLLLYTDGLSESMRDDSDEEMYGEERLRDSFIEARELPSRDILHAVIGSVYEFTDYGEQKDDITAICIKMK